MTTRWVFADACQAKIDFSTVGLRFQVYLTMETLLLAKIILVERLCLGRKTRFGTRQFSVDFSKQHFTGHVRFGKTGMLQSHSTSSHLLLGAYSGLQRTHPTSSQHADDFRNPGPQICHTGDREPRRDFVRFNSRRAAVALSHRELGNRFGIQRGSQVSVVWVIRVVRPKSGAASVHPTENQRGVRAHNRCFSPVAGACV